MSAGRSGPAVAAGGAAGRRRERFALLGGGRVGPSRPLGGPRARVGAGVPAGRVGLPAGRYEAREGEE